MKINRRITYILLVLIIIILILLIFFDSYINSFYENILISLLSGSLISFITTFTIFMSEKEKNEYLTINRLINYYQKLSNIFMLNIFKFTNKDYGIAFLKELIQNIYKSSDNYNYLEFVSFFPFFKKKSKFFERIDNLSSFNVASSFFHNLIERYDWNEINYEDLLNKLNEYCESEMLKVDEIFEELKNKYKVKINWNEIKKEKGMGFVKEESEFGLINHLCIKIEMSQDCEIVS